MAGLTAEVLAAALSRMPPRSALVVREVAGHRLEVAPFAAKWGLSADQAAVLLGRSLEDLGEALGGPPAAPVSDADELAAARALVAALPSAEATVSIPADGAALLAALAHHHRAVEALLDAAARAEARAPRRRVETALRWVAIAAVVGWWAWNELRR